VVGNAYSTPSFYIDAPILLIGKRHWIGVGGLMFQDVAGDGKLTTSSFQLTGSFHLALDKKSNTVLALGVQWGKVQRKLKNLRGLEAGDYLQQVLDDVSNAATDDELLNPSGPGGGGGPGQSDPKKDFTDINAGLLLTSVVNKTTNYNIGFSVRHITTPDYNFKSSTVDLPIRITAHAQLNTALTDKISLTPELYYTSIDPASQFQVHGWAGYMLKPEKNLKVSFGLGYRSNDAGQLLFGLDYGDLKAQIAYDVTLSSLNEANNYKGGFEIGVYFIGKIYKKPKVDPVILGPHL